MALEVDLHLITISLPPLIEVVFSFESAVYEVVESSGTVNLVVNREDGEIAEGATILLNFATSDVSAIGGRLSAALLLAVSTESLFYF